MEYMSAVILIPPKGPPVSTLLLPRPIHTRMGSFMFIRGTLPGHNCGPAC